LGLLLDLLSTCNLGKRKELTIPSIGMGLWRTSPLDVLKLFKNWKNKINSVGFHMKITDNQLFRTIEKNIQQLKEEDADVEMREQLKQESIKGNLRRRETAKGGREGSRRNRFGGRINR